MALFGSVHPYADSQNNSERYERRVVAELRRWLLDSQVLGFSGCFRSSNTQPPTPTREVVRPAPVQTTQNHSSVSALRRTYRFLMYA